MSSEQCEVIKVNAGLYEKDNLVRIDEATQKLFVKADDLFGKLLPSCVSFANHNNAHLGAEGARLATLMRLYKGCNPDLLKTVTHVRLRLNEYPKTAGLGVVSVENQLLNAHGEPLLTDEMRESEDHKAPTNGSNLSPMDGYMQVIAGFGIPKGAELFRATGDMHLRFYPHGGGPFNTKHPGNEPRRFRHHPKKSLIISQGNTIGVSIPVVDLKQFEASGIPCQEVRTSRRNSKSQQYDCRYPTLIASLRMMKEENGG